MRLSPSVFNNQLAEMGQKMRWRRAALCPCRDAYSGGANPDCPVCTGIGTFWGAAIPAWAGVVGAKARRAFSDFGRWEDGDVLISVPSNSPLWSMAENDRVALSDSSEPFETRLIRSPNLTLHFDVETIDRCFWLGPQGTAVIECDLPYVAKTGVLTWHIGANAPDQGAQFTLRGRKRPDYFLWKEIPVARGHFMGLPLPRKAVLRQFSLWNK